MLFSWSLDHNTSGCVFCCHWTSFYTQTDVSRDGQGVSTLQEDSQGRGCYKKINIEFKTLKETSSAEVAQNKQPIKSYLYAEKCYFVLDNNNYDRSNKNAFLFNSTSHLGYGLEGVTHQRLDCSYFLTFDLFSSCLDPSYQTWRKNL